MRSVRPLLSLSLLVPLTLLASCGGAEPEPATQATQAAEDDAAEDPGGGEAAADEEGGGGEDVDAEQAAAEPEESGQPTAYTIETTAPAPRETLAPGVIVAQEVYVDGGASWYVILSAQDGTVEENWRFDVATATADQEPATSAHQAGPGAFTSDFTKLAGSAQYDLEPIGFDDQVGYFETDGSFVNLSGRDEPAEKVSQVHPVFGPDDRLYYWQLGTDNGVDYALMSVDTDGQDRRAEPDLEALAVPGQPFFFSQGGTPMPVYTVDRAAAVSEGRGVAVLAEPGAWRAGPVTGLEEAAELAPTEGYGADPVAFLPGSQDELLCIGETAQLCSIDEAGSSYEVTELVPEDEQWQGAASGLRLLGDGTAAWTTVSSFSIEGEDVWRVVRMSTDGELVDGAAIAPFDQNAPWPYVVGLVE